LSPPPLPFTQGIPAAKFNSQKIAILEYAEPNSTVNVLGVVKRCGDCQEFMSKKTGTALFKRDLTLADDSVRVEEKQHAIAQSKINKKSHSNPLTTPPQFYILCYNSCMHTHTLTTFICVLGAVRLIPLACSSVVVSARLGRDCRGRRWC
jgi:hypothetical protein